MLFKKYSVGRTQWSVTNITAASFSEEAAEFFDEVTKRNWARSHRSHRALWTCLKSFILKQNVADPRKGTQTRINTFWYEVAR